MVRPGERIHVIGIAGSGAAGVALLMHHAGLRVDGCDADTPSPYTPPLEAAGIRILSGHDPAHLAGVERVAITPALRAVPDLPELVAAHERGLPVVTWQAVLGELMTAEGRIGLAVTGTHGKSTTTALLGHLLISAGLDPTVEVGAFIGPWGATVRPGNGAPFLVEADEFGDNFLNYHPAGAIVTNVEMDHPDFFADRDAVLASMERFVRGMGSHPALGGRLLLTTAADRGCAGPAGPPRRLGRARDPRTDRAARCRRSDVELTGRGSELPPVRTGVRNDAWRGSTTCSMRRPR